MKKAVITVTVGEKYEALAKATHPGMADYAEKIGADFIVWRDFLNHSLPAFKKLDIYKALEEYDRVIFFDTDIIIRDDCPDLFALVPEDKFGAFNEFPFTDRVEAMMSYCRVDMNWLLNKKYFNTGVFVCSKAHREVFAPMEEINNFYEQTALNWRLHSLKIPTFELSHKFNRMTCLDWTGESRFDSYVMHYAGAPIQGEQLAEHIKNDLLQWQDRPQKYARKIHFDANGGLGDQVCVEPVIRYLKETVYRDDDVIVTTHYPELFKHLKVRTALKGEAMAEPGHTYFSIKLPPDSNTYAVNNHILTHPVEAASLAAFKGQMPPEAKTIQLKGDRLSGYLENVSERSVLIHAGKSWQTKTFPNYFWERIIHGLIRENIPVALIGKKVDEQFGYVEIAKFDSLMVHDLRDKLSLGELISVIGNAKKGLISNDSSPVHIAGAFENPIHLITIAKAGYRILPFRRGAQTFKANVYGKLLPFQFESNCPYEVRVDRATEEEIINHLPNPEKLVEWVLFEIRNDKL